MAEQILNEGYIDAYYKVKRILKQYNFIIDKEENHHNVEVMNVWAISQDELTHTEATRFFDKIRKDLSVIAEEENCKIEMFWNGFTSLTQFKLLIQIQNNKRIMKEKFILDESEDILNAYMSYVPSKDYKEKIVNGYVIGKDSYGHYTVYNNEGHFEVDKNNCYETEEEAIERAKSLKKGIAIEVDESLQLNEGHDVQEYKGYTLDWNMNNVDPEEGTADFTIYIQKDGKDIATAQGFRQAREWCDKHCDVIMTKEFEVASGIDFDPEEYNIELIEVGTKDNTVTYKLVGKKEDIIQCIENEFNSDDYSMKDFFDESLKEENLPKIELEEPITISDEEINLEEPVLEEPSQEVVDNAYLGLLNTLISKEWDMINEYKSIIATLELDKQEELIAILNSVVDEKTIQLGMLNKAVELLDDDSVELMKQGEDKAEEILAETEAPLDESLTEAKHKLYIEVADDFYDEISYKICVANNIEKDINKYGSDAYWINDSLANLQDLEDVYTKFVLPTKDKQLIKDFKELYLHDKESEEELDESFTKDELAEYPDLCKQLHIESGKDLIEFSQKHGNVKDKELLQAMRDEVKSLNKEEK